MAVPCHVVMSTSAAQNIVDDDREGFMFKNTNNHVYYDAHRAIEVSVLLAGL